MLIVDSDSCHLTMQNAMDGTTFKNDSQSRRFELSSEGKVVGFAQYATSGNMVLALTSSWFQAVCK